MKDRHLIHLHWRSGFGMTPSSLKSAKLLNKTKNVNSIFEISKQIEPIQLDLSEFDKFLKTPYKKYKDFLFFLETKDLNEHYRSSSTVTNNIFLNPSIDFHDSAKKLKGLVDSSGKLIYSKNLSTKNQLGKLDWHQKGFVEKARKSLQQ